MGAVIGFLLLATTFIGGVVGEMAFTPPHVLAGMGIGFLCGGLICVGCADDAADLIGNCF